MVSGKLMSGEYLVKIVRGLPAMDILKSHGGYQEERRLTGDNLFLMPPEPVGLPSEKSRRPFALVSALVVGLLIGVLAVSSIGWLMLSRSSGRDLLSHVWSAVTGRTLSIDVSQPTVVE